MFWFKLTGKILQFAGGVTMLVLSRWLLMPKSYQEDIRETKHLVRLVRWDVLSLSNWLDMLPYRFAVIASHELGIAQRNLRKLRAKYERGEYASDSTAEPKPDGPANGDTGAN